MSVTTGRLAVTHRRRRSITLRAIESTSTPCSIFKPSTGILQADAYSGYNELYDLPRALRERLRPHYAGIAANARRGKNAGRRGTRRGLYVTGPTLCVSRAPSLSFNNPASLPKISLSANMLIARGTVNRFWRPIFIMIWSKPKF